MKVLFSQWMREIDFSTINNIGIPSIVLMENASRGASSVIRDQFDIKKYQNLLVFIGPGNNGGDGIAIGRILSQWNYKPLFIFLTDPEKLSGNPELNFKIIKNLGLKYLRIKNKHDLLEITKKYSSDNTVFIDAIFGTGIKNPVKNGLYFDVITNLNKINHKIISIDIPSGLSDAFSPLEGIAIIPKITISFQTLKIPHIFPDDKKRCGKIFIVDIGIPNNQITNKKYYIRLSSPNEFSSLLKKRPAGYHKGKLGHGLVIAGSDDKPGAAILSSISLLRSGAGLSTSIVSQFNKKLIMEYYPEIMTLPEQILSEEEIKLDNYDCILTGPGLGVSENTKKKVDFLISNAKSPVILDADALNILGGNMELLKKDRETPLIITPHPKEFSRLIGIGIDKILQNSIKLIREFSKEYKLYTILKGHHTIISSPQGDIVINQTGNPGMATAGSGDVLGGIIAGLISQFRKDFSIFMILEAAVFIHGYAGDIAATTKGESSMIASDIINSIPEAYKRINEYRSEFQFS